MNVLSFLGAVPPPPAPTRTIPSWVWIVVPLLGLGVLWFIGLTVTMIAIVLSGFLTLLTIQYLYPQFAKEALRYALLLVVLPAGIVLLLTISWVLPLLIFPVYLIILFSQSPKLGLILVSFLVVGGSLGAAHVPGFDPGSWFAEDSPVGRAMQNQREAGLNLWNTIRGAPEKIRNVASIELQKASGTYYEGKVDANAQKRLGLLVGTPAVGTVIAGVPVRFFTDLTAELLEDQELRVSFLCTAGGKLADSYVPSSREQIFQFSGTRPAGCQWDAGSLTPGSKTFQFNATYNFRTLAYVESSFAYDSLLNQLKQQDVNIASEYGVNLNPTAIYTNGPVMVGMQIKGSHPIPVYRDLPDQIFVWGITINPSTGWASGGQITHMGDVFLIAPKEVNIQDVNFKFAPVGFEQSTCSALPLDEQPSCDENVLRVYKVDIDSLRNDAGSPYKFPITFDVIANIDAGQYDSFMGTGLASHLFRVSIDYQFTNTKSASFTVQKSPTSSSGSNPS